MPKAPDERLIRFSEDEAQRLITFYSDAEREILDEINRALLKGNKIEYLDTMRDNVQAILKDLREGSRTWCEEAIPRIYTEGAKAADAQMKALGTEVKAGFGAIHQQAAQVLAEAAYNRFDDTALTIGRRVDDIYRTLSLENIKGSVVGYKSWQQVAQNLREQLAEQGVTGFKDRLKRKWNMRTYSEMVARTTTMEAHLLGTSMRLQENGHDLVKVSTHSGACKLCEPWQGKILSLSGQNTDYPSLQEAKDAGLLHPNCKHAYGLYIDLDEEIRKMEDEQFRKTGKSDIIKNKINIFIDAQTPCLTDRKTGRIVDTVYTKVGSNEVKNLKKQGWNFNWADPIRKGYDLFALYTVDTPDKNIIQGLIALKEKAEHYAIDVTLMESAPHNIGSQGRYEGVGAHLMAIAAKLSMEKGYDGYVIFEAKTKLIKHYEKTLKAIQIGNSQRMYLDAVAAQILIEKYFPGGGSSV